MVIIALVFTILGSYTLAIGKRWMHFSMMCFLVSLSLVVASALLR